MPTGGWCSRSRCGQWAEAEDLTAEAFLRAYRALRGYPPERILTLQPRAWLVTILLNVWRNHTRSAARRPATVDVASVAEPVDPRADVAGAVERHDTGRQLPERQRIAVVLRHVNDQR